MPKVAPRQRVGEEIARGLRDGVHGNADLTSTLPRLGAQRLAQELGEEELTDFLGRERYVRRQGPPAASRAPEWVRAGAPA